MKSLGLGLGLESESLGLDLGLDIKVSCFYKTVLEVGKQMQCICDVYCVRLQLFKHLCKCVKQSR